MITGDLGTTILAHGEGFGAGGPAVSVVLGASFCVTRVLGLVESFEDSSGVICRTGAVVGAAGFAGGAGGAAGSAGFGAGSGGGGAGGASLCIGEPAAATLPSAHSIFCGTQSSSSSSISAHLEP